MPVRVRDGILLPHSKDIHTGSLHTWLFSQTALTVEADNTKWELLLQNGKGEQGDVFHLWACLHCLAFSAVTSSTAWEPETRITEFILSKALCCPIVSPGWISCAAPHDAAGKMHLMPQKRCLERGNRSRVILSLRGGQLPEPEKKQNFFFPPPSQIASWDKTKRKITNYNAVIAYYIWTQTSHAAQIPG